MSRRYEHMELSKLFLDRNFGNNFKAIAYQNMQIALKAFEQFKIKNKSFFHFDKKEVLFGHLLTYSVEKQFCDSAFTPTAEYSVSMKQVNKYGYKTLCIDTEDFIMNIGRSPKPTVLPSVSSYKINFAKSNKDIDSQLEFQFENNEISKVTNEKKYALLTYGYKLGALEHFSLVIPSNDYKSILYSDNLLLNISDYDNYTPKEEIEESIVRLKNSIETELERII